MTKPPTSALLVGGPDAGKTNYLARAWLAMESGQSLVRASALPEDAGYVQEAAQHLLKGEYAPHTPAATFYQPNRIPVAMSAPDVDGELVIPDASGERWWAVFDSRRWRQEWQAHLEAPFAILVFYRAGSSQNVPALDWHSCAHLLGCAPENAPPVWTESAQPRGDAATAAAELPLAATTAKHTPTCVVLIDLVQSLIRAAKKNGVPLDSIRIAVLVTAWDAVTPEAAVRTPLSYLFEEMPQLAQFLAEARVDCAVECFGVSVAGGDLEADEAFRAEYLRSPHTHGYVVYESNGAPFTNPDLTLPVAWALGQSLP